MSGPAIKQRLRTHSKLSATNKRTADGDDGVLEGDRSEQLHAFDHRPRRQLLHLTASVQQPLTQYRYHWRQPLAYLKIIFNVKYYVYVL